MRAIDQIIIHCSATREGSTLPVKQLELLHRRRGFRRIGYHYYIRRDGTTHATRPIEDVGAHCKGHNAHSIGICYEGGLDANGRPKDTRTPEQRSAMRLLVMQLLDHYKNNLCICGHRDLSPDLNGDGQVGPEEWLKSCPCFDVRKDL